MHQNVFHNSSIKKSVFILTCILIISTGCTLTEKQNSNTVKDVLRTFAGEPVIPRESNRIFIPLFSNLTDQLSIPLKMALRLKEQITADGRLAVVSENDNPELLLKGMINAYQVQPVKYDGFDKPVKKRLRIVASFRLFDIKKEKEILFDGNIQAFEEFSDVIPPIITEIQIQDKVLDDLAKRIALKTIDGWYTRLLTPVEKGKK
jgi:hypothetical protein